MKLSIFTCVTLPKARGDNYKDALFCYTSLADETVIIYGRKADIDYPLEYQNGGGRVRHVPTLANVWPKEFEWYVIGEQFQRGYEACTGDWVIHSDLDFIFHEKDFGKIRQALKDYPNAPAVSFYKWQFILPDRYNLKSRLPLAVNKKVFGDRIKFNGGGDLAQPTLDGKGLDLNEIPQAEVPVYNYEKLLKTKEQIANDQGRMERAWFRHFGYYQMGSDGTNESAYQRWIKAQQGKFNKPQEKITLEDHPKYVQETIKDLTPDQWGYNGFGLVDKTYV